MTPEPAAQAPSFAEVLNLLLKAQAKEDPDRPGTFVEPTNTEIANAINSKYGSGAISSETIRKLRKGEVKSPSVQIASLIAGVFDLPLDVFNATGSETSKKVVEEVQRFLDSKRRTLSEEPREPQTVAVLARAVRRLSPARQALVLEYAQRHEAIEDMEQATAPIAPSGD
ncbi:hypothetical protein ACIQVL_03110 [Streptomyces sp. NPDC090499]|uniref:hypothetical protein n=1 Tax=Streptomyces sp. NPDC090499 TaxID=3365965 RepID=UPI00382279DE